MTKDEQVSLHKGFCQTFEAQITKLRLIVSGKDVDAARRAAGALNDAELSLNTHKHALKELLGA